MGYEPHYARTVKTSPLDNGIDRYFGIKRQDGGLIHRRRKQVSRGTATPHLINTDEHQQAIQTEQWRKKSGGNGDNDHSRAIFDICQKMVACFLMLRKEC